MRADSSEQPELLVVVPTRNRAAMAERAVASTLRDAPEALRVLVSDNSTDEEQRGRLAAALSEMGDDRVSLVHPPRPLPMTPHWQWALEQGLARGPASHVGVLQDRVVFRKGQLAAISEIVRRHRDLVLSWGNDIVDDASAPVRLIRYGWTGGTYLLDSRELQRQVARGVFPMALPRMLNSMVPVDVAERVRSRHGAYFDSISPDFFFALRCLQEVEAVGYYDEAALISYGLDRSNGASFARGAQSRDSQDFLRDLGSERMNWAAPIPELPVFGNPIFHEYALARDEPSGSGLPAIDRGRYLASMARGVRMLEDERLRAEAAKRLREEGWRGPRRLLGTARLAGDQVPHLLAPAAFGRRLLLRSPAGDPGSGIWRVLPASPPAWLSFATAADALAYADAHPPPRARTSAVLRLSLRDRPWRRTVRRLEPPAAQRPRASEANRSATSGQTSRTPAR